MTILRAFLEDFRSYKKCLHCKVELIMSEYPDYGWPELSAWNEQNKGHWCCEACYGIDNWGCQYEDSRKDWDPAAWVEEQERGHS